MEDEERYYRIGFGICSEFGTLVISFGHTALKISFKHLTAYYYPAEHYQVNHKWFIGFTKSV